MSIHRLFNQKIALFGGAGPWASAYAHASLVRLAQLDYGAVQDDDYPEILHVSSPLTGFDATGVRTRGGIIDQMQESFDLFTSWRADLAVIACNSLHTFHAELQARNPSITIMHLPDAGAATLAARGVARAAFMSSDSARKDKLHLLALEKAGIEPIVPTAEQQDVINTLIGQVMGGENSMVMARAYRRLGQTFADAGAQAILSGCTEISWLNAKTKPDFPVVDCLDEALKLTLTLAATPSLGKGPA